MKTNLRSCSSLLLLLLLAIAAVLLLIITNSSTTFSSTWSSSYTGAHYRIELTSPSESHYALQNSDFSLLITAMNTSQSNNNKPTSAVQPQLELINPVITLQMLQMDCGTVTAIPYAGSYSSYEATAAPLMKGSWVATATFSLADSDEKIVLHYPFDVH